MFTIYANYNKKQVRVFKMLQYLFHVTLLTQGLILSINTLILRCTTTYKSIVHVGKVMLYTLHHFINFLHYFITLFLCTKGTCHVCTVL